jgi:hypothetical protein
MNKVAAHCLDHQIIKGLAFDFGPMKESVHVVDSEDGKKVTEIPTTNMKALFFVKSFTGDPEHQDVTFSRESLQGTHGLKVKVTFLDDEVIYGTTNGYSANRPGFFVVPADTSGNNIRVYVYSASTRSVETWR